jgi:hypothetical protein
MPCSSERKCISVSKTSGCLTRCCEGFILKYRISLYKGMWELMWGEWDRRRRKRLTNEEKIKWRSKITVRLNAIFIWQQTVFINLLINTVCYLIKNCCIESDSHFTCSFCLHTTGSHLAKHKIKWKNFFLDKIFPSVSVHLWGQVYFTVDIRGQIWTLKNWLICLLWA